MNNPFSKLKGNLKREDHATECLVACLVFSEQIRKEFIRFLFSFDPDSMPKLDAPSEIDINTQVGIGEDGRPDILLEMPDEFVIVVEVKVDAPEDGEQLKKYTSWLKKRPESEKKLFTLVCYPDLKFEPKNFGAQKRYTWYDLYRYFQKMRKLADFSETEKILIKNFCDYLESENIVITYETKDLLGYAAGIKARKAIAGIFNEVASQLKKFDEKFETRLIDERKDWWPQLKIKHPDWKRIFGEGENWKISLWFATPGIWDRKDEEQHSLYPEIELLHIEHQNNWEYVKSKLPQWEQVLKSKGFDWNVYQDNWNNAKSIPASKIQFQPKRILCENGVELKGQDIPENKDELINKLTDWVKQYAEVVMSLGA